jgi:microcystin-dependent protein
MTAITPPYLGEIRPMAFAFAPRGWAHCNGQLLPINQNQALFSLLGTYYGGNGQVTFALPDLRGRTPLSFGTSLSGDTRTQGEAAGEETHVLQAPEMPMHVHALNVVNRAGTQSDPAGRYFAAHRGAYAEAGNVSLGSGAVSNVGGSQAHENMSPYLTIAFCIALQGIFPSRN